MASRASWRGVGGEGGVSDDGTRMLLGALAARGPLRGLRERTSQRPALLPYGRQVRGATVTGLRSLASVPQAVVVVQGVGTGCWWDSGHRRAPPL